MKMDGTMGRYTGTGFFKEEERDGSRYGQPVVKMTGIMGDGCDGVPHQWVEARWFVDARTGQPGTVCRVCDLGLT